MVLLLDYMAWEGEFMTAQKTAGRVKRVFSRSVATVAFWLVILYAIFLSREAAGYVISGMELAVFRVVPTAFVSMLVCDIFRGVGGGGGLPLLGWIFSRAFGVSRSCIPAVIMGNICGFPTGAREVARAYEIGSITKEEAERMLPIASNASPAFIVGVVGGMMGDVGVGIRLLFCVTLSTVICGVIIRKNNVVYHNSSVVVRQNCNMIESIKSAGASSLGVISAICAFAVPLGFIEKHVDFLPLKCLFFTTMELAAGVDFLVNESGFSPVILGGSMAFSLGFGGLCAMLQSRVISADHGISFRWFLPIKMLQGVVSALLFFGSFAIQNWVN